MAVEYVQGNSGRFWIITLSADAVMTHGAIMRHRCSESVWLIPGTFDTELAS